MGLGVLGLLLWIYLLTAQSNGLVCLSASNEQVVHVCTSSSLVNVSQAFMDTSRTPKHKEATCKCNIVAHPYKAANDQYVAVSFVGGSVVSKTTFIFDESEFHTLTKPSDNIKVNLKGGNMKDITYFQPATHTDSSCLNITAKLSGLTFNIQCSDAVIVQPTTISVRTSSTSDTTTTAARDMSTTTRTIGSAMEPIQNAQKTTTTALADGQTNETLHYAMESPEENAFPIIAVAAGASSGVILIIIIIVIIIMVKRSRISTKSTQQTAGEDESEDEEVENPMYNMEDYDTSTNGTTNTNREEYDNKVKTTGEPMPVSNGTFGSRNFEEAGYACAEPRDRTNELTESGNAYITPVYEGIQHNTYIDKSDSDYSYSTGFKPNTGSTKPCPTTKPKPVKLAKNIRNNDNVYDHTGDKSHAVAMNEYNHLKKVPARQVDYLNDYDTTTNTPHGQENRTREEDHYDHAN